MKIEIQPADIFYGARFVASRTTILIVCPHHGSIGQVQAVNIEEARASRDMPLEEMACHLNRLGAEPAWLIAARQEEQERLADLADDPR